MLVSVSETLVSRPTPLYGQPSWWGEEDYGTKVQTSDEPHSGENMFYIMSASHFSLMCLLNTR